MPVERWLMSRKRACVESGEYYSPVELRGLSRDVVKAILGKERTQLLLKMSEGDYWRLGSSAQKRQRPSPMPAPMLVSIPTTTPTRKRAFSVSLSL